MEIRYATPRDLERIMEIEALTFPAAEAATREIFAYRIEHFSEWFFVALEDSRVVGLLCAPSAQRRMTDALTSPRNCPRAIRSRCSASKPIPRGKGAASPRRSSGTRSEKPGMPVCALMLACKAPLAPYYEKFGFAARRVRLRARRRKLARHGARAPAGMMDLIPAATPSPSRTGEGLCCNRTAATSPRARASRRAGRPS